MKKTTKSILTTVIIDVLIFSIILVGAFGSWIFVERISYFLAWAMAILVLMSCLFSSEHIDKLIVKNPKCQLKGWRIYDVSTEFI